MTDDEPVDLPSFLRALDSGDRLSDHHDQLDSCLRRDDADHRARTSHAYVQWLDACLADAIAIRDAAVYDLNARQAIGGAEIARRLNVSRGRGQQLTKRAAEHHEAAAARVAQLRILLGIGPEPIEGVW